MSEGMNRVFLLGNLGAEPELRYTQGGQAVLNIRMATTESYLDKDKQRQEKTEWHSVVVWGPRGEGLAKILKKGDRILVEGGLRTSDYEKDGVKRYKTEIHAKEVCLAGGGGRSEGANPSSGARGAPAGGGYGAGRTPARSDNEGGGDEDLPY